MFDNVNVPPAICVGDRRELLRRQLSRSPFFDRVPSNANGNDVISKHQFLAGLDGAPFVEEVVRKDSYATDFR